VARAVAALQGAPAWLAEATYARPARAAVLSVAWAAAVGGVVTVTGALLTPAPPPGGDILAVASPLLDLARGPFRVGANGERNGFFNGAIDEVRIYRVARTADEIRDDMMRPTAEIASRAGLVAAYGFDSDGPVAQDGSGHGLDGTVNRGTWTAEGRVGGALMFDGRSSEVVIPHAAALDLRSAMTLEAWIRVAGRLASEATVMTAAGNAYYLQAASSLGPLMPAGGGRFGAMPRYTQPGEPIEARAWTHLATTYDGELLRLYVNGAFASMRVHWSPHRPQRASLEGQELRPGPVADGPAIGERLRRPLHLVTALRCGAASSSQGPAFLIAGLQSSEPLALDASGEDLLVKPLTRARRLGLASPPARVAGAFSGCGPERDLELAISGALQNPQVARDGRALPVDSPGVGSGWAFAMYSDRLPFWVALIADMTWLAVLGLPAGLWAYRTAVGMLALALVTMMFLLLPSMFGLRALQAHEVAALAGGAALGSAAGRSAARRASLLPVFLV
jgi:hypothetical protein